MKYDFILKSIEIVSIAMYEKASDFIAVYIKTKSTATVDQIMEISSHCNVIVTKSSGITVNSSLLLPTSAILNLDHIDKSGDSDNAHANICEVKENTKVLTDGFG